MKNAILMMLLIAQWSAAGPVKVSSPTQSGSVIVGQRDKAIHLVASDIDPKAGLLWRYDKKSLDVVSISKLEKYFVGPPGTYVIEVNSVTYDPKTGETSVDSAEIVLTIVEGSKPVDPVKPIDPIKPVDPVIPADPLTKSLFAGYQLDKEADKLKLKDDFAAMFAASAEDAVLDKCKNLGQLFDAMGSTLKTTGVFGKILNTQAAAQAYIKKSLPDVDRPFTPAFKAKAKETFLALSKSLKEIK